MTASTSKKVVIRRFDREPVTGFVNPQNWQQSQGLEVLSQSGNVAVVPYADVKAAFFVRDFSDSPSCNRVFQTRPKIQGIWLRLHFRDGEVLDGVMPNNLLQVEASGFTFLPPNATYAAFVPRSAVTEVHVLGVVGAVQVKKEKPQPKEQIGLFD